MDFSIITIEKREALYKEVWAEPVTTIAKRYGLSDNGLRKQCKKLGIPLPPIGYWAKVVAGHKVIRPVLPSVTGEIRNHVKGYFIQYKTDIEKLPDEELVADEEFSLFTEETKNRIKQICSQLQVKGQVKNPHHLIIEHKEGIVNRKKKNKDLGLASFRSGYFIYERNTDQVSKPILPINVSRPNINRTYRILDTIMSTLEEMEGNTRVSSDQGKDDAYFVIIHSFFHFEVKEDARKKRSFQNNRELLSHLVLSMSVKSWFTHDEQIKLEYKDSDSGPLETKIGKILYDMFVIANRQQVIDELKSREQKRVWDEREKQIRLEQIRKGELRELNLLEQAASDWNKAEQIRRFADHLERKIDDVSDVSKKEKLLKWLKWARNKADWLDPLTAKEDELLGKNKHIFELIEADQTASIASTGAEIIGKPQFNRFSPLKNT
jgi:hypothetical protein